MNQVLVAGSANLDFVVRAAHVPAPGETVLGREFMTFPGGKGANQAVASARAGGAPTHMLLALGDDAFAATLEASLQSAGVQLHRVRHATQPTGTAFVCVADDGENAITVAPGANALLQAQDLPALQGVSHLLLQLETPLETVAAYARAARAAGVQVVLNAAPAAELPPAILATLEVLVVNEGELATLLGTTPDLDRDKGLRGAWASLAVPTLIVTRGGIGCCACDVHGVHRMKAYAVPVVDTTAAGDTFVGTLAAALSQGDALPDALRRASAAAALACTRIGAQSSIPTAAEVAALMQAQTP